MRYIATMNTPGYLPQDDEPPVFDTAPEAWAYLAEERRHVEDEEGEGDYSDVVNELDAYESSGHGPDVVYGPTPGYTGRHDLGIAYSVTPASEDVEGVPLDDIPHADYLHQPGRLYDCTRYENECFCTGRTGDTECVFCASLNEECTP
jgi:hypothetical protein